MLCFAGGLCFLAIILAGCAKRDRTETKEKQTIAPDKAREVSVAAAADLKFALEDIIAAFEKEQPQVKVTATYGSSGSFFAQLSNKAPFDMFLSADMEYPRKLIEQNYALKETEFRYAVGQIVVWAQNSSPLDVKKLGIETLLDPSVRKVAIANPRALRRTAAPPRRP